MQILGIDTSTKILSIGLIRDNKLLIGYNRDVERKHSELLIPTLTKLLKKSYVSLQDIDYFACGIGPGSFTGLRIGISTIKGFAFGLNKPVVGISSLDIIANNIEDQDKLICTVLDARRGLVYSALYKKKSNKLKRIWKYRLLPIVDLLQDIKEPAIFVGDAISLYQGCIKKKIGKKAYFSKEEFWYPNAASLLNIAEKRIAEKKAVSVDNLTALYLYPKECQIRQA